MNKFIVRTAVGIAALALGVAIGQTAATPKWEAVSVRPTKDCGFPPPPGGGTEKSGPSKSGTPGIAPPPNSPDRISMCSTVMNLITIAYVVQLGKPTQAGPSGPRLIPSIPIEGAPSWATSELFQINAKAEGTPGRDVMTGPMLQALLEDRFKLQIRRDSSPRPVYALTVAKGGLKLQRSTCTPPPFPPEPPKPGENPCPMEGAERKGSLFKIHRYAKNLSEFTIMLPMDRPVIDRTGVAGIFDYHLEFAPDDTTPTFLARIRQLPDDGDSVSGPSIFTAIQEQLGLKLEPTKAPSEVLVIDHVERPSAN